MGAQPSHDQSALSALCSPSHRAPANRGCSCTTSAVMGLKYQTWRFITFITKSAYWILFCHLFALDWKPEFCIHLLFSSFTLHILTISSSLI
jgi:hypothetical protein